MSLLSDLLFMILSLPVVVMALSLHESAHGYAAYKLGDPTARSLGRITLNPVKHFDLFGFLSMLVFHIGWAKPVPINARYFKNPRRDFAIVGAAGPLSNMALALINLIVLRLFMIFVVNTYETEALSFLIASSTNQAFTGTLGFAIVSLIAYLLYMGVAMNVILAIFNLIPIPPFDGSRIFLSLLPTELYFKVMRYEKYLYIALMVALLLGLLDAPLDIVTNWFKDIIVNIAF